MDGENNGKPYEQMDDLGGKRYPYFWFNTHLSCFSTQAEVMAETPEQPRCASPPLEVKVVTPVIPVTETPVETAETPVEPVKPKVESLNLSL